MIRDIRHFTKELNLITSPDLRGFTRRFLTTVAPAYFWTIGASASGKYHPVFAKGEGGLVRHVKAASRILEELLELSSYSYMPDLYKDYARCAIILHDCLKYGPNDEPDHQNYKSHGHECAKMIKVVWEYKWQTKAPELLTMAVDSHMGQWHGPEEQKPFTQIDRIVHLADYISSRSFFDIPEITAEWEEVAAICEPYQGNI